MSEKYYRRRGRIYTVSITLSSLFNSILKYSLNILRFAVVKFIVFEPVHSLNQG